MNFCEKKIVFCSPETYLAPLDCFSAGSCRPSATLGETDKVEIEKKKQNFHEMTHGILGGGQLLAKNDM